MSRLFSPLDDSIDGLRWVAIAMCLIEFAERASYYGSEGPFNNFINNPLPAGGPGTGAVPKGAAGAENPLVLLALVPSTALPSPTCSPSSPTSFPSLAVSLPTPSGVDSRPSPSVLVLVSLQTSFSSSPPSRRSSKIPTVPLARSSSPSVSSPSPPVSLSRPSVHRFVIRARSRLLFRRRPRRASECSSTRR